MISVAEAKEILKQAAMQGEAIEMAIAEAGGFVLAEEVMALVDSPPFDQVAMDGYAFKFDSMVMGESYKVTGESRAGGRRPATTTPGEFCRVFTGAALPEGTDTVVQQEMTQESDSGIAITQNNIPKGMHIRWQGTQIQKGEIAAKAGVKLSPAWIGYLAGLGVSHVKVYPKPRVSILVTGSELIAPGAELGFGQIYESNSVMLQAALQEAQIKPVFVGKAEDNEEDLFKIINSTLQESDVLLITGGISVGKYDYVQQVLERIGVKKLFYKVQQKPGKPLYAGIYQHKLIFGLPGNPASVLTCYYEYVLPSLRKFCGLSFEMPNTVKAILKNDYKKKAGLTVFLKAFFIDGYVEVLPAQESFMLSSMGEANCLMQVPADTTECKVGDEVEVHLLNRYWNV